MKLASYKDGSRDGHLVVVSRDLTTAHYANGIASRLQQVLDDWDFHAPQLQDLSTTLNHGKARHAFPFEPAKCMAPLPRCHQLAQGLAWRQHLVLAQRATGREPDEALLAEPWLGHLAGHGLLGPRDALVPAQDTGGLDFEAQLAVCCTSLPQGASSAAALEHIRLLGLANGWVLRERWPAEAARGHGPLHSRLGTAFSPVLVTPDELGEAWRGGRLQLPLQVSLNGRKLGQCDAGADMGWHFGQLLAWLARPQALASGTLLLGGPVTHADASRGAACLADLRARETLDKGQASTPWLQFGDTVRIELKGQDGLSVFGAIEQTVADPE